VFEGILVEARAAWVAMAATRLYNNSLSLKFISTSELHFLLLFYSLQIFLELLVKKIIK